MSLLETVRGRVAPKSPSPADLLKELATAETELAELDAQYGSASLDAYAKLPGAAQALEDLNSKLAAGRERVATLRAAHKTALEREEAALRAQRKSLQQTQYRAMKKHLDLRDTAAKALGDALSSAAENYHALLDRSAKAIGACPIGMQFPAGESFHDSTLRALVTNEMYRLSAKNRRDHRALPGSETPHINLEWRPEGIKPLTDAVKEGSAYVLSKLKVPE